MRSATAPSAPSRPWWSRSKSSKGSLRANRSVSSLADEDEKFASTASSVSSKAKDALPSLKFNTLASVIGLKSKKLPALTIQDPPSPIATSHPKPNTRPGSGHRNNVNPSPVDPRASFYTNRPPAKSVSTVRSSEYDYDAASEPHSEPRTPSDLPRDILSYQQSIITFSEVDPFAAGGIVVQQDPNRLSVYSDSSVLDPHHKRPDLLFHHRGSFASSSSNSHGTTSDVPALSPLSPTNSFGRSPTASRSAHDLSHDAYYADGPPALSPQRTRRMKTPSGSNSSTSTVTQYDYRSHLSEPPGSNGVHITRKRSSPTLNRSRGMTVGAIDDRPSTATSISSTLHPTQPLQIRRKTSGSSSPSSSSNTPSPSPVTFSRTRTMSTFTESPVSPVGPGRPLVLVRKASSSRVNLPPLPAAPPTAELPPTPPISYTPYNMSPLEFRSSSSSSSLNFAPSIDLHDMDTGDAITRLMNDTYDLGPFERPDSDRPKGRRRTNRNTYILDGDFSAAAFSDVETTLHSPLSQFPPVPYSINGDTPYPKAVKSMKKMSSQQSLPHRHSGNSISSPVSGAPDDLNGHSNGHSSPQGGKTPRKQRSFHASRVPIPPLPGLRQGSSSNNHSVGTETFPQPSSPTVEPRRSSITSPRKRLFSGSSARRSSSSQGPTSPSTEDDKRSIFSFDSDTRPLTSSGIETITMTFGTAGQPLSLMTKNACISPASLWEESNASGENMTKRVSQSEYIPQHIMPPAEQLKLAEQLEDEEAGQGRKPMLDLQPGDFGLSYSVMPSAVRSRSNSVLSNQSTGTLAFGDKAGVSRGASILSSKSSVMSNGARPVPTVASSRKATLVDPARGPSRSTSMLARAVAKPPSLSVRPSTAQGSVTPPSSPGFATHQPSPYAPSAGLPLPPRRRPSRHDLQQEVDAVKRTSVVPLNPLSPPPIRTVRHRNQDSTDTTATTTCSRPPSSFDRQKVLQRRSLMKKPSFLDIEDEVDVPAEMDSDDELLPASRTLELDMELESSFLDMDRGKSSFDTVRSTDSGYYV